MRFTNQKLLTCKTQVKHAMSCVRVLAGWGCTWGCLGMLVTVFWDRFCVDFVFVVGGVFGVVVDGECFGLWCCMEFWAVWCFAILFLRCVCDWLRCEVLFAGVVCCSVVF